MKMKFIVGFLLVLFALPVSASEADQDFRLVNKTGYELDAVFLSPTGANNWGRDVMGRDVLGDGEAVNIKFSRKTKDCDWDLKVVYSIDDSSAVWHDIDLCTVEKITIRYNKNADKTTASFD